MGKFHVLDNTASWTKRLDTTKDGAPKATHANVAVAFRHSMNWQGVLALDEFRQRVYVRKPPPWQRQDARFTEREWRDEDDTFAAMWMQKHGIYVGASTVGLVVNAVAQDNTFHPIREYLNALRWDGTERISTFSTRYLGAEDNFYNLQVGQCTLISAVARVMEPGCKADYMLVLEGPQGSFKSTAIMLLFGEKWYSDDLPKMNTREAANTIPGKWVFEVSELGAMLRREVEDVKAFISRRVDDVRPFYGRRSIKQPRQCILIGTTNQDTYLHDATGGRRFWPLEVGHIDIEAIEQDRDQIWAEALQMYRSQVPWWPDQALIEVATVEQDARYSAHAWEESIANWLSKREDVSIQEIMGMCLCLDIKDRSQNTQTTIAKILKRLGWQKYRRKKGSMLTWRYKKRSE